MAAQTVTAAPRWRTRWRVGPAPLLKGRDALRARWWGWLAPLRLFSFFRRCDGRGRKPRESEPRLWPLPARRPAVTCARTARASSSSAASVSPRWSSSRRASRDGHAQGHASGAGDFFARKRPIPSAVERSSEGCGNVKQSDTLGAPMSSRIDRVPCVGSSSVNEIWSPRLSVASKCQPVGHRPRPDWRRLRSVPERPRQRTGAVRSRSRRLPASDHLPVPACPRCGRRRGNEHDRPLPQHARWNAHRRRRLLTGPVLRHVRCDHQRRAARLQEGRLAERRAPDAGSRPRLHDRPRGRSGASRRHLRAVRRALTRPGGRSRPVVD